MGFKVTEMVQANGGFFKPKEYIDAKALLIETLLFERQRPTPYGPEDSVVADITVFNTEEELNGEAQPVVMKGVRIEGKVALTRDLEPLVGEATVQTLAQVPSKIPGNNPTWVWRNVSKDIQNKVVQYGEARDAAIEEAIADAPSFDD